MMGWARFPAVLLAIAGLVWGYQGWADGGWKWSELNESAQAWITILVLFAVGIALVPVFEAWR